MFISGIFMWKDYRLSNGERIETPSLKEAERQIADVSGYVARYAVKNRAMIGWAATAGVFEGLSFVIGTNLDHPNAGNTFVNLLTYTGSLVGLVIGCVKARGCIDNMRLEERRAC